MWAPLRSLSGRVALASLILLPLFLGASGLYLERSHRLSLEAAEQERLQLQVLGLLAQADYNDDLNDDLNNGLELPEALIDKRLEQPSSGLYARVFGRDDQLLWQSPSLRAAPIDLTRLSVEPLTPGASLFQRQSGLYCFAYQVVWETASGTAVPLRFEVLEATTTIDADLRLYRRHLIIGLGGATALLILCQLVILSWGLRPLHRMARDVGAIEAGTADRLGGAYPREVQALTDNLNTLLHSEQQRRERARSTLADLAHSLKTPLAVIRSANPDAPDYQPLLGEQLQRMEEIVSYQLQRATGGNHQLLRTIDVAPLAARLRTTLLKVHAANPPRITLDIDPDTRFRGDERDLLEILGNLLDNACKYGAGQIRLSAGNDAGQLTVSTDDNGPGIAADLREQVLLRGARADTQQPGQGIGLAVVRDIVTSYGGTLSINDGPLGGAHIRVTLPA